MAGGRASWWTRVGYVLVFATAAVVLLLQLPLFPTSPSKLGALELLLEQLLPYFDKGQRTAAVPLWRAGVGVEMQVNQDFSYSISIAGTQLVSAEGRSGYSYLCGSTEMLANISTPTAQLFSGQDGERGTFVGVRIVWEDVFITEFSYYSSPALFVFNQTSLKRCAPREPLTPIFPLFSVPSASLGVLTWGGTFARPTWQSSAANSTLGGQKAGPIVLFMTDSHHAPALMASTLSDFFTSAVHLDGSGHLLFSPIYAGQENTWWDKKSPSPNRTPLRSVQFTLSGADSGISAAVEAWGYGMRHWHKTDHSQHQDVVTQRVGYWTDNGASFAPYNWYPDMTRFGVPESFLLNITGELESQLGFPMAYVQLDAWWYKLHADSTFCVIELAANRTLFPKGLPWLSEQIRAPFLLYGHMYCDNNVYRDKFEMMVPKYPMYWKAYSPSTCGRRKCPIQVAQPVGSVAEDFYRTVMGEAIKSQALMSYEVDFMDAQFAEYPEYTSIPGEHRQWLKGMADAAAGLNISVQYCMALPGQLMQSLEFPAVTNARASDDGGRPYSNMGPTNMFLWALGLRPFKDNAKTRIGNEIVGAVVAMSPVGIGDGPGLSDFASIKRACRSDGVILHPSRPGFPLNAHYHPDTGPSAETWITYSVVPGLTCFTALAGEWSSEAKWRVMPVDLPSGAPDQLMWWPWNQPGKLVLSPQCNASSSGATAAGCLTEMGADGFEVSGGGSKGQFRLYHACPRIQGWTLLGEVSKYMAVSPNRLTRVAIDAHGIRAEVIGAPAEKVELTYARPDETLQVVSQILPGSGVATFVLE